MRIFKLDPIVIDPSLTHRLTKVKPQNNRKPLREWKEGWDLLPKPTLNISLSKLQEIPFDQQCKLLYTEPCNLSYRINEYCRDTPSLRIVEKIRNSAWRWGFNRMGWNEIVDSWDGLHAFNLNLEEQGFSHSLDYTTGCNERGYGEHDHETFYDGVFAFKVYYEQHYVMTIGFSFFGDHKLLIQQVQNRHRLKNRWLFKFPQQRLEYVIERMMAAFPKHQCYIVDGCSLGKWNLQSYRQFYRRAERILKEGAETLTLNPNKPPGLLEVSIKSAQEDLTACTAKITHLESMLPQIGQFYQNTGKYQRQLRYPIKANQLSHYRLHQTERL